MFPGMEIAACPNLAVPATVMRHVVRVESGANPLAIGVVGGQLVRQPRTLDEALATVQMLESRGYNYSLGAAQVNRINFRRYGLDTHAKAFDLCANLAAGSSILADCHVSAGGDWGKAFSCYYSGNFVTGFRHGYVQKIYDSISRGEKLAQTSAAAGPIPLRPAGAQPATAASRISMRAVPFGAQAPAPAVPAGPVQTQAVTPVVPPDSAARPEVFVPQVRKPTAGTGPNAPAQVPLPDTPGGDGAFVF